MTTIVLALYTLLGVYIFFPCLIIERTPERVVYPASKHRDSNSFMAVNIYEVARVACRLRKH